jgi:hypothetical protein
MMAAVTGPGYMTGQSVSTCYEAEPGNREQNHGAVREKSKRSRRLRDQRRQWRGGLITVWTVVFNA